MNPRIAELREQILSGVLHVHRQAPDLEGDAAFTRSLAQEGLGDLERSTRVLDHVLTREKPVVFPAERIAGLRTVVSVPDSYTEQEWSRIAGEHRIHELGRVSNLSADYATTIGQGLTARRAVAVAGLEEATDDERRFLTAAISQIDAVIAFAARYADEADRIGNREVAAALRQVPAGPARTFAEALQSFRILHYCLWCAGNYHNTLGRIDQYLWPYLERDLAAGTLTMDQALELVEEFFLCFNKDSDLYPGVQQGDNGQSFVLGGVDRDGRDATNPLTDLFMTASLELKLIDPKTNLRVSSATGLDTFARATELTAQGLGFPQYSNDDVVIPGLVALGYDLEDARDYATAACWEFIVPGVGMDIPNIAALSMAGMVEAGVRAHLATCATYDEFEKSVLDDIAAQAVRIAGETANVYTEPAPFLSVLMNGCLEAKRDVSLGLKYNNYGIHGTGLSDAADSMAAVRSVVFEEQAVTAAELIEAMDANFDGFEALRDELRERTPKLGNNDDGVDQIAARLLRSFAAALEPLRNDRGGRFRAGTGSAMFYVEHGRHIGALPDGRQQGEYLSANLAPSLGVKVKGPLSVLSSFAKLPVHEAINGGPVTIEMHDTVFRTPESSRKVAQLVQSFVRQGGAQLQINALNREELRDAQEHPENHRNLIVRVWGWSAYFVELDREYQNQIIQRVELV